MVDEPSHAADASGVDDVFLVEAEEIAAADAFLLVDSFSAVRHHLPDLLTNVFDDHVVLVEMGFRKQPYMNIYI